MQNDRIGFKSFPPVFPLSGRACSAVQAFPANPSILDSSNWDLVAPRQVVQFIRNSDLEIRFAHRTLPCTRHNEFAVRADPRRRRDSGCPSLSLACRLGFANCFSSCLYPLADFFLAMIHHHLHLTASVPNRFIGCIYAIQALVRNPLASLRSGFWSLKYTHRGTDPQAGNQVGKCRATIAG
jgi:hypothetical protein